MDWKTAVTFWFSLTSLVLSVFALWRVELRVRESRHQDLLDRADEWLSRLYDCIQSGMQLLELNRSIERSGLTSLDAMKLERERTLSVQETVWDWSPASLPAGKVTDLLEETANSCRLLHHELVGGFFTKSDRLEEAMLKAKMVHDEIRRLRGDWPVRRGQG